MQVGFANKKSLIKPEQTAPIIKIIVSGNKSCSGEVRPSKVINESHRVISGEVKD